MPMTSQGISLDKPIHQIPVHAVATFRERPNRFVGIVDDITSLSADDDDRDVWNTPNESRRNNMGDFGVESPANTGVRVHVHDPGRLKEVLFPGNHVLLKKGTGEKRTTAWDVVAGWIENQWVLINTIFHPAISSKILKDEVHSPFGKLASIKPEVTIGHSRLDYLLTKPDGTRIWCEVKGCTLTRNEIALFPDAPTERGARHVQTLIELKENGDSAALIILVFRNDSRCFVPNQDMDPKFSKAFKNALENGIEVHPLVFHFEKGTIYLQNEIPICPDF